MKKYQIKNIYLNEECAVALKQWNKIQEEKISSAQIEKIYYAETFKRNQKYKIPVWNLDILSD